MLSTSAVDAVSVSRFHGLLANHLDGVVSVAPGRGPLFGGGTLTRLLAGLSSVPRDVEQIAYVDDDVLATLGIEPVLEMISWLDHDHAAVVRAVPVTDALKVVRGGFIAGEVPREALFAPQPPHIIRREALDAALLSVGSGHDAAVDPAALLVAAGHAVRVVRDVGPPLTLSDAGWASR